ncbi:3-deoxy-D-manno-octulosonate 8-phosphate phosphatase [Helicobacter didelphidarum]|uniref:3-deoxy-D-manno-octulosonate 8-phosphate phosphatase n=1 Tax=Helicobacter didelphidarum TaxID=2040648 RepID=A0A3D8IJ86_9HELI|nr:HAD hydrolase family protein [Helicobacter didelphidarum]RDU65292.1 3-deoxy-D-manno-octulosonate 8-phosphate phosphatase [Helicobacter didelphidarum]
MSDMIKMIVLDVDGTLTNGQITLTKINDVFTESKSFNVKDGMGITEWINGGGVVSIISGRRCAITQYRANELGVQEVHLGVQDKLACLKEICEKYRILPDNVACIGDDVNDINMYAFCRYSFAPADASAINKTRASFVTHAKGGEGAVREMIEILSGIKD